MMTGRFLLIAIVILFHVQGYAQTGITDSLRTSLYQLLPADRLPVLLALGKEQHSLHRDSAYQYASEAVTLAAQSSLHNRSLAALYFSQSYVPWGWIDSALAVLQPVIRDNQLSDESEREIYFLAQRQEAMLYGARTRYKEALAILYRLVSEATSYRDTLSLISNMNTIGSIALARSEPGEALPWLYGALPAALTGSRYEAVRCAIYLNLSETQLQLGRADSAAWYIRQAFKFAEQNLHLLSTAYRIHTAVMVRMHRLQEAEESFRAMQTVKAKTGVSNVSDDNIAIAEFFIQSGQPAKAISLCRKLLAGSDDVQGQDKVTSQELRLQFYAVLAKAAGIAGDGLLYTRSLEQLSALKDSIYTASSEREIAEVRSRYETMLRENSIIQGQALALARKNYMLYSGAALLLSVIAGSVWGLLESRKRQRLKMALAISEEKKLAEDGIRRAEENERARIAGDLHDNLGVYAAALSSNLGAIPSAARNEAEQIALRELGVHSNAIVAELSDTIWALKREQLLLTAISDRVKLFTSRFRKSYPQLTIEVNETVTQDTIFSPTQAFHLYRVIQEGFNNAIRHSRGDRVEIRFSGAESWVVEIHDNGIGIAEGKLRRGNGTISMEQRCLENHWTIEWLNSRGTIVRIRPAAN